MVHLKYPQSPVSQTQDPLHQLRLLSLDIFKVIFYHSRTFHEVLVACHSSPHPSVSAFLSASLFLVVSTLIWIFWPFVIVISGFWFISFLNKACCFIHCSSSGKLWLSGFIFGDCIQIKIHQLWTVSGLYSQILVCYFNDYSIMAPFNSLCDEWMISSVYSLSLNNNCVSLYITKRSWYILLLADHCCNTVS